MATRNNSTTALFVALVNTLVTFQILHFLALWYGPRDIKSHCKARKKTFSRGLSVEKIGEFCFWNCWTLYFWVMAGPINVMGPRVNFPAFPFHLRACVAHYFSDLGCFGYNYFVVHHFLPCKFSAPCLWLHTKVFQHAMLYSVSQKILSPPNIQVF